MSSHGNVDDDLDIPCYRHSERLTALRCLSCDRPICVDCARHSAVGIKCPDCARTSRAARGEVPRAKLARGVLAGAASALVISIVVGAFNISFFGIIIAYLAGMAIGEVTRRASGGYRDPKLVTFAGAAAFIGFIALPGIALLTGSISLTAFAWKLAAAAFATVGAVQRAS